MIKHRRQQLKLKLAKKKPKTLIPEEILEKIHIILTRHRRKLEKQLEKLKTSTIN